MVRIALSFDDGPGPATGPLLDLLERRGARATFFLLGQNLERFPELALRAAREGHWLGNHTWSHSRPDALDRESFLAELARMDGCLMAILHQVGRTCGDPPVRLPYGAQEGDPRVPWLRSTGREPVPWSGAWEDWREPPPEAGELATSMVHHVFDFNHKDQIARLDLHDGSRRLANRTATVEAVAILLEKLPAGVIWMPEGLPAEDV